MWMAIFWTESDITAGKEVMTVRGLLSFFSYMLAAMAGICFIGGVAVLAGRKE